MSLKNYFKKNFRSISVFSGFIKNFFTKQGIIPHNFKEDNIVNDFNIS